MTDEQLLILKQAEEIEQLKEQLRVAIEIIEETRRIELMRIWYS